MRLAHEQALRALELLLGRYPAAELRRATTSPRFPVPFPPACLLAMLERRPDMLAADRRVAAAFNRVGRSQGSAVAPHHPECQCRGHSERHSAIKK